MNPLHMLNAAQIFLFSFHLFFSLICAHFANNDSNSDGSVKTNKTKMMITTAAATSAVVVVATAAAATENDEKVIKCSI